MGFSFLSNFEHNTTIMVKSVLRLKLMVGRYMICVTLVSAVGDNLIFKLQPYNLFWPVIVLYQSTSSAKKVYIIQLVLLIYGTRYPFSEINLVIHIIFVF